MAINGHTPRLPHWHRLLLLCTVCTSAVTAWSQDFDIISNDSERRALVAPQCSVLLKVERELNTEQTYHKALCWLYGVDVSMQRDKALEALRELALLEHGAAQLALADTLQGGTTAELREALQWYDRAIAAGVLRAQLRRARAAQRLRQLEPPPDGQPTNPTNPFDEGDDAASRQPGYHCHVYGRQKYCHGNADY